MSWQMVLALTLVAVACVYLVCRGWRTWRASRAGCAGGCGCAKGPANDSPAVPMQQLTLRRRAPK